MDFKDRFRLLIDSQTITPYRVARDTGISHQLISHYLNGVSEPRKDKLSIIADYFKVSAGWLLTGLGDMRQNFSCDSIPDLETSTTANNVKRVKTSDINWIEIPFIPIHARASFVETFETDVHELSTLTIPRLPGINYEGGKIFEVDGDSMDPTLISGEQVFCEFVSPADWKYISGPVVVAFGNNMLVVKRIRENNLANGELTLFSDNEIGGKFTLRTEHDQIRRMYKVKYTIYKPIR